MEGFIIVDILFPSMKSVLKWWSQFYCLFNVETIALLYYAVFIFFLFIKCLTVEYPFKSVGGTCFFYIQLHLIEQYLHKTNKVEKNQQ